MPDIYFALTGTYSSIWQTKLSHVHWCEGLHCQLI